MDLLDSRLGEYEGLVLEIFYWKKQDFFRPLQWGTAHEFCAIVWGLLPYIDVLAKTLSLSNLQFVFAIADKIQDEPFQSAPPTPCFSESVTPSIYNFVIFWQPLIWRVKISFIKSVEKFSTHVGGSIIWNWYYRIVWATISFLARITLSGESSRWFIGFLQIVQITPQNVPLLAFPGIIPNLEQVEDQLHLIMNK